METNPVDASEPANPRKPLRWSASVALSLPLAFLPGCVSERVDELTIGEEVRLEAVDAAHSEEMLSESPSVASLDRSDWAPVRFAVPIDGVDNRWAPRRRRIGPDATPRRRGAYPTPLTAIDPAPRDWNTTVTGAVAPLDAVIDFPLTIFRGLVHDWRSDTERFNPRQRSPQPQDIGIGDATP